MWDRSRCHNNNGPGGTNEKEEGGKEEGEKKGIREARMAKGSYTKRKRVRSERLLLAVVRVQLGPKLDGATSSGAIFPFSLESLPLDATIPGWENGRIYYSGFLDFLNVPLPKLPPSSQTRGLAGNRGGGCTEHLPVPSCHPKGKKELGTRKPWHHHRRYISSAS